MWPCRSSVRFRHDPPAFHPPGPNANRSALATGGGGGGGGGGGRRRAAAVWAPRPAWRQLLAETGLTGTGGAALGLGSGWDEVRPGSGVTLRAKMRPCGLFPRRSARAGISLPAPSLRNRAEPRGSLTREQHQGPARVRSSRRQIRRASSPAPQKVSKRFCALDRRRRVSCAIQSPLASARSISSHTGAPSGHEGGIGGDRAFAPHRHAERAQRAIAGQLAEENPALVEPASDRAHQPGFVTDIGHDPLHRPGGILGPALRPAGPVRASPRRCRHIRARSVRHSRCG